MTKKRSRTAEELMAELAKDSEFLRRRAQRDEKNKGLKAKYAALEAPVLETLASYGYQANSIEDAVKIFAPLPEALVDVLLQGLDKSTDDRMSESLVRALGAAQRPFDGTALVRCYEKTYDDSLRWAVLNTIALAAPHSIDAWLGQVTKNPAVAKTLNDLGYKPQKQRSR
jgi:hypothetical protein